MTGSKLPSRNPLLAKRVVLTWLAMTAIAILLSLAAGERMRSAVFDGWQKLQPRDLSASDVRVVLIDDASIEELGPWPWPRYYLARLTEQLTARGARVVAFDVLFPERDRISPDAFLSLYPELSSQAAAEIRQMPPMDELFAKVIGQSPVVLAHAAVEDAPPSERPGSPSSLTGRLPPAIDSWPSELVAIPELDDIALGNGLVNVRPDPDGVIRSIPLVLKAGGTGRPSFATEIARNAMGSTKIEVQDSQVVIGDRAVPTDRRGRMHLHFGHFPHPKVISASSVLSASDRLTDDFFAGKVIIIGVTAEGTSDIASTPLAAEEFGPLIQAQAVDSILRGGWLERPSWMSLAEWAAAAVLAVMALGNALFGRASRALLAIAFVTIPIASWLAFANAHVLFDPSRPLVVGGGAAAGVAMGMFAVARIDRERLREALFQEKISAAAAKGELQAARAIQLGMVPPRQRLSKLDPRIDIDAILEPAKSVGGDYYDAIKIGDDRLGFAMADVTGKGVPAALYMAMSKALTSAALSRMQVEPDAMAAAVNMELLKDNSEAMSVTMLLGVLDLASGEVKLICAGHEDPVLLDDEGRQTRIALVGGPPFSIAEFTYPLERIVLRPGDTLLLVTDGVTEAQNAAGELFGRDRVLTGPNGWRANARSIVDRVRDQVREFEEGTEATDDLTVMAIRYFQVQS